MVPLIHSGNLVEVHPVTATCRVVQGDIVLCRVGGAVYLHRVAKVTLQSANERFTIANAKGHVNGICSKDKIYGVVNKVSP
jgi:SOS-response transcriptional repressor LexA